MHIRPIGHPELTIWSKRGLRSPVGLVDGFIFGRAKVLIAPQPDSRLAQTSPRNAAAVVLASLGISASTIGKLSDLTPHSANNNVVAGLNALGVHRRDAVPQLLLDDGSATIDAYGEPLLLSSAEQRVTDQLVAGRSNREIATNIGLSALTVKTHLANIGERSLAPGREAIVWQVLVTDPVMNY